jgi:DNA-binding CsgD family transcriptional regulator
MKLAQGNEEGAIIAAWRESHDAHPGFLRSAERDPRDRTASVAECGPAARHGSRSDDMNDSGEPHRTHPAPDARVAFPWFLTPECPPDCDHSSCGRGRSGSRSLLESAVRRFEAFYRHVPLPSSVWQRRGADVVLLDANHAAVTGSEGRIRSMIGLPASLVLASHPALIGEVTRCVDDGVASEIESDSGAGPLWESGRVRIVLAPVPPDMAIVYVVCADVVPTRDDAARRRADAAPAEREGDPFRSLSPRERQIALSIVRGADTRQVASQLYLSPRTVRNHLQVVFRKLGVHSQVELVSRFREPATAPAPESDSRARAFQDRLSALSKREREIAARLVAGKRATEIADEFAISAHTARNHVKAVYRKLGVHSHLELVQFLPRPTS